MVIPLALGEIILRASISINPGSKAIPALPHDPVRNDAAQSMQKVTAVWTERARPIVKTTSFKLMNVILVILVLGVLPRRAGVALILLLIRVAAKLMPAAAIKTCFVGATADRYLNEIAKLAARPAYRSAMTGEISVSRVTAAI